jgi:hypothetical protein
VAGVARVPVSSFDAATTPDDGKHELCIEQRHSIRTEEAALFSTHKLARHRLRYALISAARVISVAWGTHVLGERPRYSGTQRSRSEVHRSEAAPRRLVEGEKACILARDPRDPEKMSGSQHSLN